MRDENFTTTDINECGIINGGCDQTCTNIIGSYTCSCQSGFVLNNDNHNCTGIHQLLLMWNYYEFLLDINECLINNGGCHHNCSNSIGSYTCQCNDGFTSTNNGEQCTGMWV